MSKRQRMSRKASKKLFSKTASVTHPKNVQPVGANSVMRGGIRL